MNLLGGIKDICGCTARQGRLGAQRRNPPINPINPINNGGLRQKAPNPPYTYTLPPTLQSYPTKSYNDYMTNTPNETLQKFPCDFTIKVFGLSNDEFEMAVLGIINKHVPNLADRTYQSRQSEKGKYMALSITVHVHSKEQLDRIYQDLSSAPQVLMAL